MKSVCNPRFEPATPKFPCLMEVVDDDSTVVLLVNEHKSSMVVFSNNSSWKVGETIQIANLGLFLPFKGEIKLSS